MPPYSSRFSKRSGRSSGPCLRSSLILAVVATWARILNRLHHSSLLAATDADPLDLASLLLRPDPERASERSRRLRAPPFEVGAPCLAVGLPRKDYTCGSRIEQYVRSENISVAEAAGRVRVKHPVLCGKCIDGINERNNDEGGNVRYWRYDLAAPPVVPRTGVTHFLTVIPSRHRIPDPASIGFNLSAHLADRWFNNNNDTEFYFEYNPSLVLLPEGATKDLDLPEGEEPKYLMSLRVVSANHCFPQDVFDGMPPEQEKAIYGNERNYVALVLLRRDLSIIHGMEIVISHFVNVTRGETVRPEIMSHIAPGITDYRLFATADALYFNINAYPVHVVPFSLTSGRESRVDYRHGFDHVSDGGHVIPNRYGTGFHVRLHQNMTTIWEGGLRGKNYAMFLSKTEEDEVLRRGEALVELQTWPQHVVRRMRLDEHSLLKLSEVYAYQWPRKDWRHMDFPRNQVHERKIDKIRRRRNVVVGKESATDAPGRSFASVDEFWFRRPVFKEVGHGGACCVSIDARLFGGAAGGGTVPTTKDGHLLLGIGHSRNQLWTHWYNRRGVSEYEYKKIPPGQYVSFFYVFEPRAPYAVRFVTGYFCLGLGDEAEDREGGLAANPYRPFTRAKKFAMNYEEFDCPKISYVSSISEKAGDERRFIVAYGINDCTPRLVEMDKSDIARYIVKGPNSY